MLGCINACQSESMAKQSHHQCRYHSTDRHGCTNSTFQSLVKHNVNMQCTTEYINWTTTHPYICVPWSWSGGCLDYCFPVAPPTVLVSLAGHASASPHIEAQCGQGGLSVSGNRYLGTGVDLAKYEQFMEHESRHSDQATKVEKIVTSAYMFM